MDFRDAILLGDCLDVLRQLPDACVDSVVTDVPYGLGTREPTVEDIIHYLRGEALDTGGDFMGTRWEIPSVAVWKECYRVLKPGGHVLSFGGTRTFDLISIGLRAAGFENRDTIAEDHPALQWKHGQGFPKSLNIGKAIDKSLGAERTVEWEGYGTALKPSWEPILVFRKPVEGTIAENVLKYGTGGMNIDASRVKHASAEDFEKHKAMVDRLKEQGGSLGNSWKNSSDLSGASEVKTAGRWPPNAVMTHAEGCKNIGTRKVKGNGHFPKLRGPSGEFGKQEGLRGEQESPESFLDDETVEDWECVEGCPVKALDEQTGERRSSGGGGRQTGERGGEGIGFHGLDAAGYQTQPYFDSGGASRFFPQFEGQEPVEVPFFYTAKATKKEATLDGEVANPHPTKKPVALMRWLVKLVTPKGGITLDPYCGSGSTCVAAIEEGMHFVGIEKDPVFHASASKRLELVIQAYQSDRGSRDIFDAILNEDIVE